jgi:TonB family protein
MRSLFQNEVPSRKTPAYLAGISIGVHALLLALIVIGTVHAGRIVVLYPQIQGSVRAVSAIAYNRGTFDVLSTKTSALADTAIRPQPIHKLKLNLSFSSARQETSSAPQPVTVQASGEKSNPGATGAGNDAQSMDPAYPVVFPSPKVKNRSLLPQAEQRVIVDVDLDANGKVLRARLVNGIGNALDEIVLNTVYTWQFHPAMLNRVPVAASAELVFPFDRNYPFTD